MQQGSRVDGRIQGPSGVVVLRCGDLACEPCAPVGQADWGRPADGLVPSEPKVTGYNTPSVCKPRQAQPPDPDGLVPSGESGSRAKSTLVAGEPLLQTGQARLGAVALRCGDLACEPCAPVGQADWGRAADGQARLGAGALWCGGLACEPCAPVGRADWGRATDGHDSLGVGVCGAVI